MEESSADPPFEIAYKNVLDKVGDTAAQTNLVVVEEGELPLVDMKQLGQGEAERQACKKLIAQASQEWGFFQVINHGVSEEVVENMRSEQVKLLRKPFEEKRAYKEMNLSAGSYRWGAPSATSVNQLSWSEAFHLHLTDVFNSQNTTLRFVFNCPS